MQRQVTRRTPDIVQQLKAALSEEGRSQTTRQDENGSAVKRRKVDGPNSRQPSPSATQSLEVAISQTPLPQIDEEYSEQNDARISSAKDANSTIKDNPSRIEPQQSAKRSRKKKKSIAYKPKRRSRPSLESTSSREQHSSSVTRTIQGASGEEEDDIDTVLKPLTPSIRMRRRTTSLSITPLPESDSDDDLQSSGTPRSRSLGDVGKKPSNGVETVGGHESLEIGSKHGPRRPVGRPSLGKNKLPSVDAGVTPTPEVRLQTGKRRRGRPSRTSFGVRDEIQAQAEESVEADNGVLEMVEATGTENIAKRQAEEKENGDDEEQHESARLEEHEGEEEEEGGGGGGEEDENSDGDDDDYTQAGDASATTRHSNPSRTEKVGRRRKLRISQNEDTAAYHAIKPGRKLKKQKASRKRPIEPSSSSHQRQSSQEAKSKDDTVPVTVHRISHIHRLNFIDGEDDDLAGPPTLPKKSTVNAIDVLSQLCREMIGKTVEDMRKGAENERREERKAEWKRKRKAVQMFGDELDGRLFQMVIIH